MILFRGIFNWFGVNHTYYSRAVNKDKVFMNFCYKMSKDFDTAPRRVMNHFLGNGNYMIEEIKDKQ